MKIFYTNVYNDALLNQSELSYRIVKNLHSETLQHGDNMHCYIKRVQILKK